MPTKKNALQTPTTIYKGDSLRLTIPEHNYPKGEPVPYGTDVNGMYFDGYPQLIKQDLPDANYEIKIEKDVFVTMRDGVRILVDIYRPDTVGEKFPAILSWGLWGKDAQEAVAWNKDKPQPYHSSPFWDGTMEAGDFTYLVPRGYVHIIADPRGIGHSEGAHGSFFSVHQPEDIHDTIEWIAKQPWSNGKVGMIGPSS